MTFISTFMRLIPTIAALALATALAAPALFFCPEAEASFCNVCPPWGVGCGFLDLCSCLDLVSCFSGISILSCFNCGNLVNILGIIANCFSMFNYSVECGWNFLSYCYWPCTLFSCFNLVNFWSGRINCFNVFEVMSGVCSFGNLVDVLSGSCVNLMSCVKVGSGLYPPFIASGGCLNVLTGCNPCNPCLPCCFSTGITDLLEWICAPFVAPIQCVQCASLVALLGIGVLLYLSFVILLTLCIMSPFILLFLCILSPLLLLLACILPALLVVICAVSCLLPCLWPCTIPMGLFLLCAIGALCLILLCMLGATFLCVGIIFCLLIAAPVLLLPLAVLLLTGGFGLTCAATGTVPCAACLGPLYEVLSRIRSYLSPAEPNVPAPSPTTAV